MIMILESILLIIKIQDMLMNVISKLLCVLPLQKPNYVKCPYNLLPKLYILLRPNISHSD